MSYKKIKIPIILAATLFIIITAYFLLVKFPIIRFYPKLPKFENENAKWYSCVNNFTLESVCDEQAEFPKLVATVSSNGNTIDLECEISLLGELQFYNERYDSNGYVICANCNIKDNGDVVLKNIKYAEKTDWEKTPKRITLAMLR